MPPHRQVGERKSARVFFHSGDLIAVFASFLGGKNGCQNGCQCDFSIKSVTFVREKSYRMKTKVVQPESKCGTFDRQKCHTCNSKFVIYNCSSTKSAGTQRPTEKAAGRRFFRPQDNFCATTRFWRWILLLKFSNLSAWVMGFLSFPVEGCWGVWELMVVCDSAK